ncbi:unnamed protein product, partial [Porites lobata]
MERCRDCEGNRRAEHSVKLERGQVALRPGYKALHTKHSGPTKTTIQATMWTYFLLKEEGKELWTMVARLLEIDTTFETCDKFFNLNIDVKKKYAKRTGTTLKNGWVELERERGTSNMKRPADLKESFDFCGLEDENYSWPNEEVPNFQGTVQTFYEDITNLASRMMSVIAISLDLDPDTFAFAWQKTGTSEGGSQLRYNYYPMISDLSKIKPGQIRCGEHTDYGGITLLFQDDVGGLEVINNVDGQFVSATPMRGAVLVLIADLMQRWTSDRYKSVVHRVLIPEEEIKRRVPRR